MNKTREAAFRPSLRNLIDAKSHADQLDILSNMSGNERRDGEMWMVRNLMLKSPDELYLFANNLPDGDVKAYAYSSIGNSLWRQGPSFLSKYLEGSEKRYQAAVIYGYAQYAHKNKPEDFVNDMPKLWAMARSLSVSDVLAEVYVSAWLQSSSLDDTLSNIEKINNDDWAGSKESKCLMTKKLVSNIGNLSASEASQIVNSLSFSGERQGEIVDYIYSSISISKENQDEILSSLQKIADKDARKMAQAVINHRLKKL